MFSMAPEVHRWQQAMPQAMAPRIAPMGVPSRAIFRQPFWNNQTMPGNGAPGGIGAGNNPGGQPGLAGQQGTFGKEAADAIAGLALGGVGLMGAGTLGSLASHGYLGDAFGNVTAGATTDALGRTGGVSSTSGQQLGDALAASSATSDAKNRDLAGNLATGLNAGPTGGGFNAGTGTGGFAGSGAANSDGTGYGGDGGWGYMHKGGIVPGRGNRDTQRERLTPGEGVLTKQAVSMLHPHVVMMLNAMAAHRGR